MESAVPKKRGRPRKRRREDGDENQGVESKKQVVVVETKPIVLVGRYMLKQFNHKVFLGKVVYYLDGLYRVNYEDGDFEDLESREIRGSLVEVGSLKKDMIARRKKLDELVARNGEKPKKEADEVEEPAEPDELIAEDDEAQVDGEEESSSDACENLDECNSSPLGDNALDFPPPELPASSGNIGVSEWYVSHLLSVYGFLRSFSISLYLCPFTLDDFVGSLNCRSPNTLLDAIHVAVMRALRDYLETLSSDGLELASKCLRSIDWNLLDTLTWPVYLIQYLTIMGYSKGPVWKGFYDEVLGREYYSLSADRKLLALQVLCDDVLDSAELRAEINLREESEVGTNYDEEAINTPENGPRRVHPRYSKTSACKDRQTVGESYMTKSPKDPNVPGSKGGRGDIDAADMDMDRNSDDCRLCGMDGTLLCCDGCPSAYHTRCIGVMKLSIPDGSWYCPECTINKIGPAIATGTSLKGGDIFGVDLYGQIFLGTCNHLLVLRAALVNEETSVRYYNEKDIPKVMHVLCSSAHHGELYLGICQEIVKYWDMSQSILSLLEKTVADIKSARLKEEANLPSHTLPLALKDNTLGNDVAMENNSNAGNPTSLENSVDMVQADSLNSQTSLGAKIQEYSVVDVKQYESNGSTATVIRHAGTLEMPSQSLTVQPSVVGIPANGTHLPLALSSRKEVNCTSQGKGRNRPSVDCVYRGSHFKPQAYLNHYMHGYFAASAAEKLTLLSSEESRSTEAHGSDSSKKAQSETYLQTKAFSLVASRFFWPTSERKLVEVPRERCGWCLSCKAIVSSKRGCMLNHSLLCATKGAMKSLASIRPIKSGEGALASIGAYIIYMEESLCGVIIGPFMSPSYRKQWRQQVEQAKTCFEIKSLLLELEENIRTIALSSDWVKLVDDWLAEYSVLQSAACVSAPPQKRAPGRRSKKQASAPEIEADGSEEKSFVWWQGGQKSKLVFQKAILPSSMVRQAAQQGGSKKISGICYTDGIEIPKRSKRFAWRAAVEMSKNASQLALQVRNLDLHVRWSELVHPDQNLVDVKSAETEASVFRNAMICGKNVVENKVTYGVAFGSQKHLPNRVMKNIITEQSQDGQVKFWFPENKVPLYLIKSYERNATQAAQSNLEPLKSPQLHKKRMKSSQRDIFFYLSCKRDNIPIPTCNSCKLDVLRPGATCGICKAYCHKECAINSTVAKNEDIEFLIMCKQCYNRKLIAQTATRKESPTSPLNVQAPVYQKLMISTKSAKLNRKSDHANQATSESASVVKSQKKLSKTKQAAFASASAEKSQKKSWGVVWKKNSKGASALDQTNTDSSAEFRHNNVLLKGGFHRMAPECHLCRQAYRQDQMYLRCESCFNWYHAEALDLHESKIFDVAGFKCCKCRRIRSPKCPFTPEEKTGIKRIIFRPPRPENSGLMPAQNGITTSANRSKEISLTPSKQESFEVDTDSEAGFSSKQSEPSTPMFPLEDSDPLLFSISSAELLVEPDPELDNEWENGGQGPQKLQVRRHVRREGDADVYLENGVSDFDYTQNAMENPLYNEALLEWDAPVNDVGAGEMAENGGLDFETLDYDPQTFFTFSELLGVDGSAEDQLEFPKSAASMAGLEQSSVCQLCSESEQEPDLSCQNCGVRIHSQCLPQSTPLPKDCAWKCNQCREWC